MFNLGLDPRPRSACYRKNPRCLGESLRRSPRIASPHRCAQAHAHHDKGGAGRRAAPGTADHIGASAIRDGLQAEEDGRDPASAFAPRHSPGRCRRTTFPAAVAIPAPLRRRRRPATRPRLCWSPASFGGWCWNRVTPLLRAQGHDVFTPTLTGLGERAHLARPETGLATHVDDVVNLLQFEDLQRVVLVGHSYGGKVITGVADRVPEQIARVSTSTPSSRRTARACGTSSRPTGGRRWRRWCRRRGRAAPAAFRRGTVG